MGGKLGSFVPLSKMTSWRITQRLPAEGMAVVPTVRNEDGVEERWVLGDGRRRFYVLNAVVRRIVTRHDRQVVDFAKGPRLYRVVDVRGALQECEADAQ